MKWVTWEQIGVDRMACIWLIRRWIDPKAEFLFIPAGTESLPKGAEPFDIPGVRFSHYRGHCTFHTLLKEHGLKDPILIRIASIIDEADIVQEANVEPTAYGLDLLCRGLRRISRDDHEALERGMLIYEALYAELSTGEH
ncbi:MAG: chromate resistance protein [Anaerolineales bacterium]|nr:MAG: chromate resistance protein [Anaerolineales bacterium]